MGQEDKIRALNIYKSYMSTGDKLLEALKQEREEDVKLLEALLDADRACLTGPKVTLSCADAYLIDKALELLGVMCKFEVREGLIVKIEKVTVEELNALKKT